MDSNVLVAADVEAGQKLVSLMDSADLRPRAALWVYSADADTWRLWVVPPTGMSDKREFYRRVSELITRHREELPSLQASDTEFVADSHPAIRGLARFIRLDGLSNVRLSSNVLDGYYLPDAVILRMAL